MIAIYEIITNVWKVRFNPNEQSPAEVKHLFRCTRCLPENLRTSCSNARIHQVCILGPWIEIVKCLNIQYLLLFPWTVHFWSIISWITKKMNKNLPILFKDVIRHCIVPLKSINLVPEFRFQVCHISPFFHFYKKFCQWKATRSEQSSKRDSISIDVKSIISNGW